MSQGEPAIRIFAKQLLSVALSSQLVVGGAQPQQTAPTAPAEGAASFSANDLQQLVAPIALYPDALVAQVLGAATFPDQIQAADGWLQQNKSLTGDALMQAVDKQQWDPSVKALTQFPSVLNNLAKNLKWTGGGSTPFHGYYFRMLTGQTDKAPGGAKDYIVDGKMLKGFAFVAYPAKYGDSGIMTFITNQDGLLLQKDLGRDTTQIATAMSKYDADFGWNPVGEAAETKPSRASLTLRQQP